MEIKLKKRILIVEDDSAILETLSMFLQYEGYEVLKASELEESLRMLSKHKPDLVILDYMLHGQNSRTVVDAVRARYGAGVVILLLTAIDNPAESVRGLQIDGLVSKPFELDYLLREIEDHLAETVLPEEAETAEKGSNPPHFSILV